SIAAPDDDVPELAHREGDRSLETVVEGDGLPLVDPDAQRRIAGPPRSLTAGARIACVFHGELAARAAALERMAAGAQRFQCLGIKIGSAALVNDLAVPPETEDLEGPQHLFGAARHHARAIQILDPHEPAAAAAAGIDEAADGSQQ